jgi:hypothetical protein
MKTAADPLALSPTHVLAEAVSVLEVHPQPARVDSQSLGAEAMPTVVEKLKDIGEYVLAN